MYHPIPEDFDEVVFPTLEEAIYIHDNFALLTGGLAGISKPHDLEGAIGRPQQAAMYDLEADFVKIAAYYWHGISTSHGFADGNKRTGLLVAVAFLEANGFEVEMEENHPGEMVDAWMASGEFEIPLLDNYLRERTSYLG